MNFYSVALFVHLCGVIGVFAGLGTWLFCLVSLWRAQRVEQVRTISDQMTLSGNIFVASLFLLAAGGFYMAATVWGPEASWIIVATLSFVFLGLAGTILIDRRVRAIARLARSVPDGALPKPLVARTHDPLLYAGLQAYVAGLFGIVFLMAVKPELGGSLLVMGIALALGLISGMPYLFLRCGTAFRASETKR